MLAFPSRLTDFVWNHFHFQPMANVDIGRNMRACPMQVTTAAAKAWQTSIVTDTGDGPEVSARTCAASTNTNDSTPVGTRKAAVTNTRDSTMWWDEDSTEATEANVVLGE
jgi:hypothetical protein